MATKTGTLALQDLRDQAGTASATQFGEDRIAEAVAADLAIHNGLVTEQLTALAEPTSDRIRRDGSAEVGEMIPADEFTRGPTQKVAPVGANVGFPLDGFQYALGWTQKFLQQVGSAAKLVEQVQAAQLAHLRKVAAQLKRALYTPTNVDFYDYLVPDDSLLLPVRRFYNADSTVIAAGPNGEAFDGATHQHFLANATLTAALVTSLVNTVREHRTGAQVQINISAADEAAFTALAGFKAYTDARLTLVSAGDVPTERLNLANPGNRAIGLFGDAEVWVKPWAIANYLFAYDRTAPRKPLALRTRSGGGADLAVVAENRAYPLIARYMEAEFGFGVQNRAAGAVAYFAGGTYTAPSITG